MFFGRRRANNVERVEQSRILTDQARRFRAASNTRPGAAARSSRRSNDMEIATLAMSLGESVPDKNRVPLLQRSPFGFT